MRLETCDSSSSVARELAVDHFAWWDPSEPRNRPAMKKRKPKSATWPEPLRARFLRVSGLRARIEHRFAFILFVKRGMHPHVPVALHFRELHYLCILKHTR